MVTLPGLCGALPGVLVPQGAGEVPAVPVGGVHVSELLDPTPFLDGGELLLTTGLVLPEQGVALEAYVARLVAQRVCGLALGLGPVHRQTGEHLRSTCARAGLPLFSVPAREPFQAVIREYWTQVGAQRSVDARAALGSVNTVVQAAFSDDAETDVLRATATALGGRAALFDADGRPRRVHPPSARSWAGQVGADLRRLRLAAAHTSVPTAATFSVGQDDVLVHAVNGDGFGPSHLAVGGVGLPPHTRHLVITACALLRLRAERSRPLAVASDAATVVLGLLARGGHDAALLAVATALGRRLPSAVRVVLVRGVTEREVEMPALRAEALIAPGEPMGLVVAADRADDLWRDLQECLPASGRAVLSGTGALHETTKLVERSLEALTRDHARWVRSDIDRSVVVPDLEQKLSRLLAYERTDLIATLAAYLRHRGRIDPAADELRLHRNSLRHRLTVVRRIVGDDLDDADVAAWWWLTLRDRGLA
ncbi:MAG: PucR family transcriptional regulator ligand-binding domain-containing protein [Mobilicoccus sp.]|nr:PucR family transcriptional regulator ligand-binding domain-containing protein [Mobilicoccus sp.]